MKRIIIVGFLGLWGFTLLQVVGCRPMKEVNDGDSSLGIVDSPPASPDIVADPSCANLAPVIVADCQTEAQQILDTTVRLEFHGPGGGIGHGTILSGRYLITHNHYPVSGEALSRDGDGLISAVSIFRANGDVILLKAPLSTFLVLLFTPEVLVLDFREHSGIGFFDSVGVPSAKSTSFSVLNIKPGSEVAQINWDMTAAYVIWARVTAVQAGGNAPYIELASFVEQGASGGGVFYNGYYIANNWTRNIDRDASTGEVLRQYSVAAINTGSVLSATSGTTGVPAIGN